MEPSNQVTPTTNKNKQVIATIVALVAIVAVVFGAKMITQKKDTSTSSATQTTETKPTASPNTTPTNAKPSATPTASGNATGTPADSSASSTTYRDGTYSATGSYVSPGGSQQIAIKLTIAGDKVTTADVTEKASDRESKEYQDEFIDSYKRLVVGKSVDEIKLSKVSGSSLTSKGFNDALDQIKQQANS